MVFISDGVQNVIHILSANKRPEGSGYFPDSKFKKVDTRVGNNESVHSWFCRCSEAAGSVERLMIEDNIGLIGVAKWTDRQMTYLNMQAIVSEEGTLEDFYIDETAVNCHYTRLELDFTAVGPLFKEHLPHIHSSPDGPPRYCFAPAGERVLIPKFLEFLYLNYAYDKWLDWVREIWLAHSACEDDEYLIEPIIEAYNASKSDVLLRRYSENISRLRDVLARECACASQTLATISLNASMLSY